MTIAAQRSEAQPLLTRIEALAGDQWRCCGGCAALLHRDRLAAQSGVCPECGWYFRLGARERIAALVDPGTFVEHPADARTTDPLAFVDSVPYPQRLARARSRTGLDEAVVVGVGQLGGVAVTLVVFDFDFLGGSMGSAVGEGFAIAARHARTAGTPLVSIAASGGARMQEGVFSLLQMAKTAAEVAALRQSGTPFVSVLTDPVFGGVSASFAALGDVIVAERGARAGFAGRQVIEQTIRQRLPAEFQTAEFLVGHGHIDAVVDRAALPATLRRLVYLLHRPLAVDAGTGPVPVDAGPVDAGPKDSWDAVTRARTPGRPTVVEYVDRIFTGFVELRGDRWSGDDQAVVGGLAQLDGRTVMVLGHAKGRNTAENVTRNFGMPHPSGFRKAIRLYQLAERLGVPVVTFVDTAGAYPGMRAEEGNQSGAIAEALAVAAGLRVPMVTVVTGEGGSGGALALAVGDRLLMQRNTIFSVISPEGCATILFGDAGRAPEAARALRVHAEELYAAGVADEIVGEPDGGAHADPGRAADLVADALRRHLAALGRIPVAGLLAARGRRLAGHAAGSTEPAERLGDPHV